MLDWLNWLADLLLGGGGIAASLFAEKGTPRFEVIQMMSATLILAAIVSMIVYWQSLVDFIAGRAGKSGKRATDRF
jgi:hypothetical protein